MYKDTRSTFTNDDIPSTSNKFSIIQNDHADDDTQTTTKPKPSPIYIPYVVNIDIILSNIWNIIPKVDFNYKSLRNNQKS